MSVVTTRGPVRSRRQRLLWSPVALTLVLLMAAGSVLMWIGLPLGLLWLASGLTDSPQPSLGPHLLVLLGLPLGMVPIGRALGALDRAHGRVTGRLDDGLRRAAWLHSARGARAPHRTRSVLGPVMVVSVVLALIAGGILLAFAGSPLPD